MHTLLSFEQAAALVDTVALAPTLAPAFVAEH